MKRRSYKKIRTLDKNLNLKYNSKKNLMKEIEEKKMLFFWNVIEESGEPVLFKQKDFYERYNIRRMKKVEPDGNCQFRAISDQIYGSQEHYDIVKERILESIEESDEFYKSTFESVEKYKEWITSLKDSSENEWGTIETLRASCIYYNRKIIVYDRETLLVHIYDPRILRLSSEKEKIPFDSDEIILLFNGENHYDSVLYKKND